VHDKFSTKLTPRSALFIDSSLFPFKNGPRSYRQRNFYISGWPV